LAFVFILSIQMLQTIPMGYNFKMSKQIVCRWHKQQLSERVIVTKRVIKVNLLCLLLVLCYVKWSVRLLHGIYPLNCEKYKEWIVSVKLLTTLTLESLKVLIDGNVYWHFALYVKHDATPQDQDTEFRRPTSQAPEPIFTQNTSNDVISCKDVPFRS